MKQKTVFLIFLGFFYFSCKTHHKITDEALVGLWEKKCIPGGTADAFSLELKDKTLEFYHQKFSGDTCDENDATGGTAANSNLQAEYKIIEYKNVHPEDKKHNRRILLEFSNIKVLERTGVGANAKRAELSDLIDAKSSKQYIALFSPSQIKKDSAMRLYLLTPDEYLDFKNPTVADPVVDEGLHLKNWVQSWLDDFDPSITRLRDYKILSRSEKK